MCAQHFNVAVKFLQNGFFHLIFLAIFDKNCSYEVFWKILQLV